MNNYSDNTPALFKGMCWALVLAAFFIIAATVYAQDSDVSVDAEADVELGSDQLPPPPRGRNPDVEGMMERREQLQETRDERREQLQGAAEERREMFDAAREQRDDMVDGMKDHMASTTDAMRMRAQQLMEKRDMVRDQVSDRRDQMRENFQEKRDEIMEKRDERKQALRDQAKDRFGAYIARIVNRLNTALERLTQIANRIESRIAKMESEHNVDLSAASDALADARALINAAGDDVEFIGTVAEDVLSSDNPGERFGEIRDAVGVAKESLKGIHQALRDAVVEIKASAEVSVEVGEDEEGEDGTDGADGENGQDGTDGSDGEDGEDGSNATE